MPLHVHFDTKLRSKTENTWPFLESHDYNPQIKVINSHLILIDENLIPDLFFCFFVFACVTLPGSEMGAQWWQLYSL